MIPKDEVKRRLSHDEIIRASKWSYLPELGRIELGRSMLYDTLLLFFATCLWILYRGGISHLFPDAQKQYGASTALQILEVLFDISTIGTALAFVVGDILKGAILVVGGVLRYLTGLRNEWSRFKGGENNG